MILVDCTPVRTLACIICGGRATHLFERHIQCPSLRLDLSVPVCSSAECTAAAIDFIATYSGVRQHMRMAHA
jgi:hypothetical protein